MQGRISNIGMSFVLVLLLGVIACSARPPHSDIAYGDTIQDAGGLDNNLAVSNDGHPGARLLPNSDDIALAPFQLQLLQQYANSMRNYPWEQILRAPQDKRQIRYRQCYFNPISCFRK